MLADAGLQSRLCCGVDDLHAQPVGSYGSILLTEDVLTGSVVHVLSAFLDAQPAWSDLPVVVFVDRHRPELLKRGLAEALGPGRGIILLERPVRVASFASVMRSVVLARRRQHELRDQLVARQDAETRAQMLADEISHRIKNSLAMVSAIASQTFHPARPVEEALHTFSARLKSMALAQDVLIRSNGDGADLHQIISQALAPYQQGDSPDRISATGPEVWLKGSRTTLTMAMHELATNAVKYGALSVGSGRVAVRWRIEDAAGGKELLIEWREQGGPPVTSPERRGFGSVLVERGLAAELRGTARIFFQPEGVVCEIRASLEDVSTEAK